MAQLGAIGSAPIEAGGTAMAAQADRLGHAPAGGQAGGDPGGERITGPIGVLNRPKALRRRKASARNGPTTGAPLGGDHQGRLEGQIPGAIALGWIEAAANQGIQLDPRLGQQLQPHPRGRRQQPRPAGLLQRRPIGRRHDGSLVCAPADGYIAFPNVTALPGNEWFYFAQPSDRQMNAETAV